MKIGIDASNIRSGGGLTHLMELLNSDYVQNKLSDASIEVWGGESLSTIKENDQLVVKVFKDVDAGILRTLYWRLTKLKSLVKEVDVVFAPGGLYSLGTTPYVSMSQNMLVFQQKERDRFPLGINWLRYNLLEILQLKSFKKATGILFISKFAKEYISDKYPVLRNKKSSIVYHGISDRFRNEPKGEKEQDFIKFLYVSIVNFYKHQWNVVRAIEQLNLAGYPCKLELIGPNNPKAMPPLNKALASAKYSTYSGPMLFEEIQLAYHNADAFIFASTCENMPNILVEAMSAGLPIFSSNYGPMPEILGQADVYFDPTDVNSIYECLLPYVNGEREMSTLARENFEKAKEFSWEDCAKETFDFIKSCNTN